MMDTSIWIVEMTAGKWGWNWSKRNIIPLKIEKVTVVNVMYNCTCFVFCSTSIFKPWTVCSSFNIQYQSTGIGSLSLLDKIESIRSLRRLFLSLYGTFRRTCLYTIFSFFFLNVEEKKNFKITMVEFQQQSSQRLVVEYEHMNNRNDRLDLRLNPLQRENYFIEYGKSYVKLCNTL